MDQIQLRHKGTGERIIGTYDCIPGCALVSGFTRSESGVLIPEYAGETDVWWDNQETETDVMTLERYFVTEGGDVVSESECEIAPNL